MIEDRVGVFVPARIVRRVGPRIADAIAQGYELPLPPDVRSVIDNLGEVARFFRRLEQARREDDVRSNERPLAGSHALGESSFSMITTEEAAEMLGTGVRAVQARCARGTLRSQRRGRAYLVSLEDVMKMRKPR